MVHEHVARRLHELKTAHGADSLGALASPHPTFDELALLAGLARGLRGHHVAFPLPPSDISPDGQLAPPPGR